MPHPSPVARVGQFPKPVQQPLACVGPCLVDPPVHQRLLPADSHGWVYQTPSNTTNQHNRSTTLNGSFTSSPEPWAEWHWEGSRVDGTRLDLRGVTIFGVRDGRI